MTPDPLAQSFAAALALHQSGQFAAAQAAYESILKVQPDHADALQLLGTLNLQTGRHAAAAGLLGRSLEINPAQPGALSNLGLALRELGRYGEALAALDKASALDPDFADAHNNRADTLVRMGRHAEALAAADRAIALKPALAVAWHGRANALSHLNRAGEAIAAFDRARQLGLDSPGLARDRGQALLKLNRLDEALAAIDRAAAMELTVDVLSDRGVVLIRLKRPDEALACFDHALTAAPDDPDLHVNRSTALSALGRNEEALAACERALALDPRIAQAEVNRGNLMMILGRFGDAEAAYGRALALNPDHPGAAWNRALLLLKTGRFAEGWRLHEARKRTDEPVGIGFEDHRLWLGEPAQGQTILLHWEQGLGDTLQFCRYAKMVKALGAHPILLVQPPLKAVVQTLDPAIPVLADGEPLPAFDAHTPLLSLPLALGGAIPSEPRYLAADAGRLAHWARRLGRRTRRRVGLAWSGNPAHTNDRNRSLPLPVLAPLLSVDADFVCLQKDLPQADRAALGPIAWFGGQLGDFADTAALAELMDLVITVDTSAAHLAGALGKPVWLLLPTSSDWRWMTDRTDTPWYPSMRLFRQAEAGDWPAVIARVGAALESSDWATAGGD
jgi:tetratricopeptide (TPR) repeat protein